MKAKGWIVLLVILALVSVLAVKENFKSAPRMDSGANEPALAISGGDDGEAARTAASLFAEQREGPLPGSALAECLQNGFPTMADFGLGTCETCKQMAPVLHQAAIDYVGKANVLFIELDKYPNLAHQYGIAMMPTEIFFDGSGKEVYRRMGYMGREEIDSRMAEAGVKP
ncbi:MAG: thioredoxin fold domain-containing protein [Armatimonadetes bacterium]|nr:thioredoxin fold domain-containing protein [Armatimonadota bacterium]NIM22953.1 thioredoxin fold domain-containing protein [Armatimonadota bacterium]NIM66824.1 thioredoxin fold domain-containing protein [Armatimonadota bacterium]NIM75365.1 thioredoxin fold domain-containing protein [Armatimonadota bacterium]NIN05012.1 thioredoxin fold domain-containing protein [Armatimonadota bacterium]